MRRVGSFRTKGLTMMEEVGGSLRGEKKREMERTGGWRVGYGRVALMSLMREASECEDARQHNNSSITRISSHTLPPTSPSSSISLCLTPHLPPPTAFSHMPPAVTTAVLGASVPCFSPSPPPSLSLNRLMNSFPFFFVRHLDISHLTMFMVYVPPLCASLNLTTILSPPPPPSDGHRLQQHRSPRLSKEARSSLVQGARLGPA